MKKGLLRTLSALLAVSMLLCMSMVAFADGQTYNVTTTYDGTNVTVTTAVAGAVPSEQVAFLVEKGSNIVWIDQKPADNAGGATSTFTDTAANAVGATVKVGTSSLAANTFGDAKSIALPNYTVTWTVEGVTENVNVVAVAGGAEDADGSVSTSRTVTFYVAAPAGVELVEVNGEEPTIIGDAITYDVAADTAFTFTFAAKDLTEAAAPAVPALPEGAVVKPSDDAAVKAASVAATATNAIDFGLLVAVKGSTELANITSVADLDDTTAPVRKYAALGANAAGEFVIQLVDSNDVFFVDGIEYEARVYAVGSELTLGEVFDLN